jgi:hypothetical protein
MQALGQNGASSHRGKAKTFAWPLQAPWLKHGENQSRRPAKEAEQALTAHFKTFFEEQRKLLQDDKAFVGKDVVQARIPLLQQQLGMVHSMSSVPETVVAWAGLQAVKLTRVLIEKVDGLHAFFGWVLPALAVSGKGSLGQIGQEWTGSWGAAVSGFIAALHSKPFGALSMDPVALAMAAWDELLVEEVKVRGTAHVNKAKHRATRGACVRSAPWNRGW